MGDSLSHLDDLLIERYLQQSCSLTLKNNWISRTPKLSYHHLHARHGDDGAKETCSAVNTVRGIEWSLRATAGMRAVYLFLRAQAFDKFFL